MKRAIVIAGAAVLVLTACTQQERNRAQPGPSLSASPSVSVGVPFGVQTPELAAQGLYDAWVAGDPGQAANLAEPEAITKLFQTSGQDATFTFMGCEQFAEGYNCSFYTEGTGLNMVVRGSAANGFWVSDVKFIAD